MPRQPRDARDLSNLSGTYGKWTIIRKVENPSGGYRSHYLCRCACGTERVIKPVNLVNNKSTSCGRAPCAPKKHNNQAVGELSGAFWGKVKRNATTGNIPFDITQEQGWQLFLDQGRRCALTGIPLTLTTFSTIGTASLNRIDSTKPYTIGFCPLQVYSAQVGLAHIYNRRLSANQ
jgi:hypothetical protein